MDAVVSGIEVEGVEIDRDAATVRTTFDREKTPASTAVIATLAEAMNADPAELDPLYSAVDPDALDVLTRVRTGADGDTLVTFRHEDHAITVYSYGVVTVTPGHEPPAETSGRRAGR